MNLFQKKLSESQSVSSIAIQKTDRLHFLILTIAITVILGHGSNPASGANQGTPTDSPVLVINSYQTTVINYDNLAKAFDNTVQQHFPKIKIRYITLPKNIQDQPTKQYLLQALGMSEESLASFRPRVFVTIGEQAKYFSRQIQKELYPNVPRLFLQFAQGNTSKESIDKTNSTGLITRYAIDRTLKLAMEWFPATEEILILSDKTELGEKMTQQALEVMSKLRSEYTDLKYRIISSKEQSTQNMLSELESLPKNRIVLLATWSRGVHGVERPANSLYPDICRRSAAPVFGVLRTQLPYGIIGGKLSDPKNTAIRLGQMLVQILKGTPANKIPIQISDLNSYSFDQVQLNRWQIASHFIPPGSEIVHKPTFMEQYGKNVFIGAGAIIIQSLILISLVIAIVHGRRIKKRLRQKEHIFETISTHLQATFGLRTINGWRYISKSYNELFGLDREAMYQDPLDFLKVVHPNDKDMITEVNRQIVNQEPLPEDPIDLRIIVDGKLRWIEMTIRLIPSEEDDEYLVIALARDITQTKLANIKLVKSEAELTSVLNNVTDGVLFLNKEKQVVRVNQAAAAFVNQTPEELIGVNCPNPWCTQSDGCNDCPVSEAMNSQKVVRRELKNINDKLLNLSAQPVIDELGENIGSVITYNNVTLYKKTEESLRESEEQFRKISEAAIEAIIVADPNGIIVQWNPAAEKLFGYSKDEAFGKQMHALLCPSRYQEKAAEGFANYKKAHKGPIIDKMIEIEALRKDGTECPIEISITTLQQKGQTFAMAVVRDITERRNTQKAIQDYAGQLEEAVNTAQKATEAKSFFLSNMSHEIRTPMNGVIGMTELLLDTKLTHEQREYAKTVRISAEALLSLINDILDFSKIEAGQLEMESIDFSLRDVVDQVAEIMSIHAIHKKIEYISHVHPTLPARVIGDPNRLRQILINLINNAIKFTDNGEVAILVTPQESLHDKGASEEGIVNVCFEIHDTGIGISKEVQAKIFSPFTQEDSSTTRRFGGTGLGLSICKQLAELMGGSIKLESKPDQGTSFRFTIPLRESNALIPSPDKDFDILNYRILVVDDNSTNRHLMNDLLSNWGIAHRIASSAQEGLDILREAQHQNNRFDILIVDLAMPEMDGFEMTQIIREKEAMHEIKIVMMSSLDCNNQLRKAKKIGIDLYLTKPVRQSCLFDCLCQVLSQSDSSSNFQAAITQEPSIQSEPSNKSNDEPTGDQTEEEQAKLIKRILVAEDNPINQKVIFKIIERLNYNVTIASNGAEAIRELSQGKFDLVFMDVQMPIMDGYEATQAIRDKSSKVLQPNIPIVAMTAHAMKGDREKCIEMGMDSYLCKPVRPKQVRDIIERFLNPSVTKNKDLLKK
jgi:PAS domain S-box-containing protein